MSDVQPNRPRFQLRLLTCVVLMVSGGLLIWLNVVNGYSTPVTCEGTPMWGWPMYLNDAVGSEGLDDLHYEFNDIRAFGNLVICLLILAGIARGMEWFLDDRHPLQCE